MEKEKIIENTEIRKLKEHIYLVIQDSSLAKKKPVFIIGQDHYYMSDKEITLEEIENIDLDSYIFKTAEEIEHERKNNKEVKV